MSTIPLVSSPPKVLDMFNHTIRWQLLQALAFSDLRVRELIALLNQPPNLVSYHLQKLRRGGLLHERRSLADGRELYYSLDLDKAKALYFSAGLELHPALSATAAPASKKQGTLPRMRVLFLCTHNSARSQMAEGLLRSRSRGQIEVHSAGTEPSHVHPLAIRALQELNIDISQQHSKSIQEYQGQRFDYVITVCDRARESCPVFPGNPVQIHWSFPDPAESEGSETERVAAFREIARQLNMRIAYWLLFLQSKSTEE